MPVDFIYADKRNLCPHCGHDSGCKIFVDEKVWCLRVTCQFDISPGWKLIGWLRQGMGASLVPDTRTLHERNLEEYKQRRREWKEQNQAGKLAPLPIELRDTQYHRIARTLSLSRHHRTLLTKRGLREEEMDSAQVQGWLLSWQPGNYAFATNPYLAGVNPVTHKLVGVDGFAIAALDPDGHITGYQLAPDNRQKYGKYIWLSSKRYSGNGPHLPNQELPLFAWKHPQTALVSTVLLIEGALKSLLVALFLWRQGKTDIAVIGTASAARYGEQTLQDYLLRLEPEQVILLPDAGAVLNRHIDSANQQTLSWLQEWGYSVQVADWGQLEDKQAQDFDELLATHPEYNFHPIPPEAYFAKSPHLQEEHQIFAGFKHWLQRLFKRYRPKKGFGPPPVSSPPSENIPAILEYKKGKLPKRSEISSLPSKIIYKKEDRSALWQEAVLGRWKHILDTSAPGLGKSHTAGELVPETLGVSQLWYFAEFARNVTTENIKNYYTYLEPRHNGLVEDFTPQGKPYLRRPKEGEEPTTPGNCHRADLFLALYSKNIPFLEGKNNPVCNSCHLRNACRGLRGEGFGHRYLRAESLESDRVLAHLDSAPGKDFDWSQRGLIFDEAMRIIKPVKTIEVFRVDVSSVIVQVVDNALNLAQIYKPLWNLLRDLLGHSTRLPKYGLKDNEVRQLCWDAWAYSGESCDLACSLEGRGKSSHEVLQGQSSPFACLLEDSPFTGVEELRSILQQDLSFLSDPDKVSVGNEDKQWKGVVKLTNRHFQQQGYEEMARNARDVLVNWFVPFLEILSRNVAGSFQITPDKKLVIGIRNSRHAEIADASAFNLYLDATAEREYLALWLHIPPEDILQVQQEQPSYNNLEVIQVQGLGLAGKERSALCDRRIAALINQFRQDIPNIVIEDWKDKLPTNEPLYDEQGRARYLAKFRDTRGTNYALDAPAIASFGIPYPNIGWLECQFGVLTGKSPQEHNTEFREFVDWIVQGEVRQTLGRLRSHLRPQQKLKFYFCADYDLSFLTNEGISVKEVEAFQITPEAGDATQMSRWVILKGYEEAVKAGSNPQKVKLKEIAAYAELSVSRVGQVAAEFGGVKMLRKILEALIAPTKEELKNLTLAEEDILWLARSYLPMALEASVEQRAKDIFNLVKNAKWNDLRAVVKMMLPEVKAQLLGFLLTLLPQEIVESLQNELIFESG